MEIRPFRPHDLAPLAAIMRQTLELPQIDPSLLARDFLLAAAFTPDQLLVAETECQLTGFLLAPRHDPHGPPGTAWIAAFGVLPGHRQGGVATALLDRGFAAMRRSGITRIDVADVPVRYLLPGIDAKLFPSAHRLLTSSFGFTMRDEVDSMGFNLLPWQPPTMDTAIRPCTLGEYPLLRSFLAAEFESGWWEFFERSIRARLDGNPEPSEVICWWDNGRPAGAVHFRNNRFGPLAVSARLRRRGIGERLTYAALAGIKAHGFAEARFMMASADVQRFYRRLGFYPLRRFARLTRAL